MSDNVVSWGLVRKVVMIKVDGDEWWVFVGEVRKGFDDFIVCYMIGLININCYFIIFRDVFVYIY